MVLPLVLEEELGVLLAERVRAVRALAQLERLRHLQPPLLLRHVVVAAEAAHHRVQLVHVELLAADDGHLDERLPLPLEGLAQRRQELGAR